MTRRKLNQRPTNCALPLRNARLELIGVRVQVDADGAVTGEPKVVDMYTDGLSMGLDD